MAFSAYANWIRQSQLRHQHFLRNYHVLPAVTETFLQQNRFFKRKTGSPLVI
jgi:hypothetical protein